MLATRLLVLKDCSPWFAPMTGFDRLWRLGAVGVSGVEENPLLVRARAMGAVWWFPLTRFSVAVGEDSVLMRGAVTVGTVMLVASELVGGDAVV